MHLHKVGPAAVASGYHVGLDNHSSSRQLDGANEQHSAEGQQHHGHDGASHRAERG